MAKNPSPKREASPPSKACPRCGRTFAWRKKWAADWERVVYCSKQCRSTPLDDTDRALEQAILAILARRGRGKTLCPSEAARKVGGEDAWRPLMERARRAARRLWLRGDARILQRGRDVGDPSKVRGPIRIGSGE